MFDLANPLAVGASVPGADGLAELIVANRTARLRSECELLVLAALWADAHDPEVRVDSLDRCRCWGGEGTPQVTEYAHDELGALLHTSGQTAAMLMADALDLRHRLPETWDRVRLGTIRAFQARAVAQATRHLAPAAAMAVDDTLAPHWVLLPWPRLSTVLHAAILDADPDLADQRARAAETERFVRTGRGTEHGLKLFIARANAGDVIFLMAMINRLAEILSQEGDTDPVEVRRATALGLLANPAHALQLLIDHATPDPTSDAPGAAEPDPEADDHRTITIPGHPHPGPLTEPGQVRTHARRLAPVAIVHVHFTDRALVGAPGHSPVTRFEGVGPVLLSQVRRLLDRPDLQIRIQPVIDPAHTAPVDAYEIPHRLREAVRLRHLTDTFPYGTCDTRTMDLDHTMPHGDGGVTSIGNLTPLTRHHHRAKTHGGWGKRQPDPDTIVWRSPHGWIYLVTPQGTLDLGRTDYAHALWHAATGPPVAGQRDEPGRSEVELAS